MNPNILHKPDSIDVQKFAELRQTLESNPSDTQAAKQYWLALENLLGSDVRSGRELVEIFRQPALASREGVVALAIAYKDLHWASGEIPRAEYFDAELIRVMESHLPELSGGEWYDVQWVLEIVRRADVA